MYGKHFASMYTGSMFGSGAMNFAIMGYVIANMKPDKDCGAQVEMNPDLLAAILGEDRNDVEKAIEFMCAPDPKSRSKEEGGRRLIRLGQFDYQVVNGPKYLAIRNEEERREKNRERQRKHRKSKPLNGESEYLQILERDGKEAADAWLASRQG